MRITYTLYMQTRLGLYCIIHAYHRYILYTQDDVFPQV